MGKGKPKPPARWAYVLSGSFFAIALAIILLPPFLSTPDVDDPNPMFHKAVREAKRLTIVSGEKHVSGRAGTTLRTIDDPVEIRSVIDKIALMPNPVGRGFRARELAKYKLVFDATEVEFVMDQFLRSSIWQSDYRLTAESAKFLWELLGRL
jgi:hypothetical protein